MKPTHAAAALLLTLVPGVMSAQQPAPSTPGAKASPSMAVNAAFAREQQVWDALKAADYAAFNKLVNGTFTYIDPKGIVGWNPGMTDQMKSCSLASFSTEDVHTHQPAAGVVVLSYKATVDQTCNGVKSPSPIYVLSVWQRKGASWGLVAHSETSAAVH